MRKITGFSLLPLILLAACSGAADGGGETSSTNDPPDAATGADAGTTSSDGGSATSHDASGGHIQVQGHVVDDSGDAYPGARVRVVDAKGVAQDALADASGGFSFSEVAPPYDVSVRPSASTTGTFAYLGLTRTSLRIVDSAGDPAVTGNEGNVSFTLTLPACGTSCLVDVTGSSSEGSGAEMNNIYSEWSMTSSSTQKLSIRHDWTGPATTNKVLLDVLVSDESYQHFWYARTNDANSLTNGGTLDFGAFTVSPIPTFGPLTITTDASAIPASLSESYTQVTLLSPTGASLPLQFAESGSLVTFLPDIAGATFNTSSSRTHDVDSNWSSSAAKATNLPLSTSSVPLKLVAPLASTYPAPSGTLSASATSLTWVPTPGHTTALEVGGATVFLDGAEVSMSRLTALGVTLTEGAGSLYLYSGDNTSVDSIVDPARIVRSTRWPVDMNGEGRISEVDVTITP